MALSRAWNGCCAQASRTGFFRSTVPQHGLMRRLHPTVARPGTRYLNSTARWRRSRVRALRRWQRGMFGISGVSGSFSSIHGQAHNTVPTSCRAMYLAMDPCVPKPRLSKPKTPFLMPRLDGVRQAASMDKSDFEDIALDHSASHESPSGKYKSITVKSWSMLIAEAEFERWCRRRTL